MQKIKKIPKISIPKKTKRIPIEVAENIGIEDIEAENFLFSFKFYNNRLCQLSDLESAKLRKILKFLKVVGKLHSRSEFSGNNINIKPVKYVGEYKKLYKGLSQDIDIREYKIGRSQAIFFWILSSIKQNIIYLICLRNRHFEINKIRR